MNKLILAITLLMSISAMRAMDLIEAAKSGDEQMVAQLIKQKANIDQRDTDGKIAIEWAKENNHESIVNLLVHAHAKNSTGTGESFMWAANGNHEDIVAKFISIGVRVESLDHVFRHALRGEGNPNVLAQLIAAKASANALGPCDYPPLALAATRGLQEIVCLLIQAGANVYHRTSHIGNTALREAAVAQNIPLCELLVEKMLCILRKKQKQEMYTFLNCLQRNFDRGTYHNLRDVFKEPLRAMIREENAPRAQRAIDKLKYDGIKQHLLQKYFPGAK
jgi:ankyrin repeat protein